MTQVRFEIHGVIQMVECTNQQSCEQLIDALVLNGVAYTATYFPIGI